MGHVYLSPSLPRDPQVMRAGYHSPDSIWLWIEGLCWRSRYRHAEKDPDTFLPAAAAKFIMGRKRKPLKALITSGLWEPTITADGREGYHMTGMGKLWRIEAPATSRPAIPEALRHAVYERDGYACVTCGTGSNLTLDHIYPWSLGGPDTFENFQTMCRSCNSRKGARV